MLGKYTKLIDFPSSIKIGYNTSMINKLSNNSKITAPNNYQMVEYNTSKYWCILKNIYHRYTNLEDSDLEIYNKSNCFEKKDDIFKLY